MKIEYIIDQVKKTVKKYDETDPIRLADAMKIIVSYKPMGTDEGCIKGFFVIAKRIKAHHYQQRFTRRTSESYPSSRNWPCCST